MMNDHELIELANATMPFGKHQGQLLLNVPERYLIWLNGQDKVSGKLKNQLIIMAEIKLNGLEGVLKPLIKPHSY